MLFKIARVGQKWAKNAYSTFGIVGELALEIKTKLNVLLVIIGKNLVYSFDGPLLEK